jgi:hypothetical protein
MLSLFPDHTEYKWDKEKVLQQLKDNGLPLQITKNIELREVLDDRRMNLDGVAFFFTYYNFNSLAQYEIEEDEEDEVCKCELRYVDIDNVLMSSFEDFCNDEEIIELLKDIYKYLKEN